jgi:hypothetical protein
MNFGQLLKGFAGIGADVIADRMNISYNKRGFKKGQRVRTDGGHNNTFDKTPAQMEALKKRRGGKK